MTWASTVGRSEEATRVSEASGIDRRRRKTTPSSEIGRAPKWEARREARFPPASFASDGPEPEDACFARLRAGGAAREWTLAWSSTEPKGSGTRATLARRRKASPEKAAALGSDDVRVLEWERFQGAEVDRTHLRSRRPWEQFRNHGHARPSAKESLGLDEGLAMRAGE
jgi:hypothetical protein